MLAAPSSESFPKVVIVGAGIAGLSAARELLRRGWPKDKVVLLEASGNFGGRMRTRRHRTGALYDHGAAYVHGTIGNPLVDLAKEAGITLKQVSEANPWVETTPSVSLFCGGERASDAEAAATDEAFCGLMDRIRVMARECDDANAPAAAAIEGLLVDEPFRSLSALELARLRLRVSSLSLWHGCDMQDMQLRSLEFEDTPFRGGQGVYGDFPGPHCVVEGGVERIAEAVASPQVRECLRLNAPVSRIAIVDAGKNAAAATTASRAATKMSSGAAAAAAEAAEAEAGGVEVSFRKQASTVLGGRNGSMDGVEEMVRAQAVIVAVPLSVLQEGTVEFDPPLPEETSSALSRLRMGNYEKVFMEFAEPFWPADAPFIGCCCPQPSPLLRPPLASSSKTSAPTPETSATATTMAMPPNGGLAPEFDSESVASLLAVGDRTSPCAAFTTTGAIPADAAAAAAAPALASASYRSTPLPASPILLENYLWLKGVPVLAAAVTGERARMVSAAAASTATWVTAAGAAAAGWKEGSNGAEMDVGEEGGRSASHAQEVYRRLIKPALVAGLGRSGEELPEPVSLLVTSWAQEPFQRGSYSYFPLGARDDDIHAIGQGGSFGLPEAEPGTAGSERVFFAGEATIPGLEGSMHGAYLSGVRAAEDIACSFGFPL